jgi:hypothetical protein
MISARLGCAFLVAAAVAAPASADVTLRQKFSGKMAMAGSMSGDGAVYIKGNRMRNENGMGGQATATIFDLDSQQMIVLNEKRREADVYDMAKMRADLEKVSMSDIQARVTPTPQTREIAGQSCTVHNMEVVVPTDMGGEKIKLLLTGPVCLSKTAPGQAELAAFYKAASEKGMIFGDARAVKAQPGNARGMSVFYREMTSRGVPLAQEMSIKFEGTGPMAGMMSKMGGTTMTTEAVSIAADPIPDSMFEIPAGYKVNKR